tara:strand:- start:283 stop:450 length:168 start_codon:yes stop_codon:yes gene_type:complete
MNIIKMWLIKWLGIDTIKSELIKEWEESVVSHLNNSSNEIAAIINRLKQLEKEEK